MLNIIFMLMLFTYYLIITCLLLVCRLSGNPHFTWMHYVFACIVPIFGGAFLGGLRLRVKNREKDVDYYSEFVSDARSIHVPDIQNDLNVTSITDILLYEDAATKRNAIMRIFRGESNQFTKELKKALEDPDTEISHYASSSLTDIKRKFDNDVIELGRQLKEDGENTEVKYLYVKALQSYIESGILDPANQSKYQRLFCKLTDELFRLNLGEGDGIDMTVYKDMLLYLQELGEAEKAQVLARELLACFDHEVIYFAVLRFYYIRRDREAFFETIDRIKNSRIKLSPEKLASFRYFIEPQSDQRMAPDEL